MVEKFLPSKANVDTAPSNRSHAPEAKDTLKLGVKNQQGSYALILLKLLPEMQGLSVNCSLEVKG